MESKTVTDWEGKENRVSQDDVYYDYEKQTWIKKGKVSMCGHREPWPNCYACQHWGESAERRKA